MIYDQDGQPVPRSQLEEVETYAHCAVSAHCSPVKFASFASAGQSWREAAQFELMLASRGSSESCLSFAVEGESHHLYEVRVHKLLQRGDVTTAAKLEVMHLNDDEESGIE